MPTDAQFKLLVDGLKALTVASEQGNLRQGFAALRQALDAIDFANQIAPPAVDPLPTAFSGAGLATLGSAPAAEAPGAEPATTDPAELVLRYAGLPAGDAQLRIMRAWVNCEAGTGHNNPLNVTAPLDSSWRYAGQSRSGGPWGDGFWNQLGGVGVVMFDNLASGAAACAKVLQQANFSLLYAALSAGDGYRFVSALGQVPWGTSPQCVASELGIEL